MFGFLSGLQLLHPWGLAALLAVPLLILAYLRRESARRRVVSSVLVLRELTKRPARRQRFKPPLRFFLELLALLLLGLAASMPLKLQTEQRVAVVIDSSLSMRTSESTGTTRFALAQRAANDWMMNESSRTRYVVYSSSPRLKAETDEAGVSRDDAQASLRTLSAGYSTDTLEVSLQELARSGRFSKVLAVSDRSPDFTADTAGETASPLERSTEIVGVKVGNPAPNISLNQLSIAAETIPEPHDELVASIAASGRADGTAKVSFTELLQSGESKLLAERTVSLHADGLTEVRQPLSSGGVGRRFRVSVTPERGVLDALTEDNSGWILSGANEGRSVLVVSDHAGDTAGLDRIPGLSVTGVDVTGFNGMSRQAVEKTSLLVFHRTAPASAFEIPTLVILPPEGNTAFPVRGGVSGARIASWREEHPLLSYLRVPLLPVQTVEVFDVPLWAESVVQVEQGSILVAGESRGVRFVGAGFELLPFEGAKSPAASVLTLNMLHWLSGTATFGESLITGGAIPLEAEKWQITLPDGSATSVEYAHEGAFQTTLPGLYRLERSNGARRTVAVNSFHPEESQTALDRPYGVTKKVNHPELDTEGARPLWPGLLMAIAGLLTAELCLVLWQARRGQEVV